MLKKNSKYKKESTNDRANEQDALGAKKEQRTSFFAGYLSRTLNPSDANKTPEERLTSALEKLGM